MTERPQMMTITDQAAERVKALLASRGKPSAGVRIGIRTKGCSGMSYTLEFADDKNEFDEVVEDKGVRPESHHVHHRDSDGFRGGQAGIQFYLREPERKGALRLRRVVPRVIARPGVIPAHECNFGIFGEKESDAGASESRRRGPT